MKLECDVIIARQVDQGICEAIEHHNGKALVMGWKGYTDAKERVFGEITDNIIRYLKCDLMFLKTGQNQRPTSCLLPTAGGPNAHLAASVAAELGRDGKLEVTPSYVVPPEADNEEEKKGREFMKATAKDSGLPAGLEGKIIKADSIAGGIAKTSCDYDLVVIGATEEPFFRKMLFGNIPEKVARFCPASVLVVKKYEGAVKTIIKKALG